MNNFKHLGYRLAGWEPLIEKKKLFMEYLNKIDAKEDDLAGGCTSCYPTDRHIFVYRLKKEKQWKLIFIHKSSMEKNVRNVKEMGDFDSMVDAMFYYERWVEEKTGVPFRFKENNMNNSEHRPDQIELDIMLTEKDLEVLQRGGAVVLKIDDLTVVIDCYGEIEVH